MRGAAVLQQILAELRALRGEVRELRGLRAAHDDQVIGALLDAIANTAGDLAFTARELVMHASLPDAAGLHAAIIAAAGALNARCLGHFLRAIEGRDVNGMRIVRHGADRDGVIWALRVCEFETRRTHIDRCA